jgi:hypothetical protein
MAGSGTFESPAVSNGNGLPDEQPFIVSGAVQIQRIVRGIATHQETSYKSFRETASELVKKERPGSRQQAAEQEGKRKEEQRQ